jgi:hypothetical protein
MAKSYTPQTAGFRLIALDAPYPDGGREFSIELQGRRQKRLKNKKQ